MAEFESLSRTDDLRGLSKLDRVKQLRAFKAWFRDDSQHSAKWRRQAREDFKFIAGEQWNPEDKAILEGQKRPPVVFNRTLSLLKAVAGIEINSRHEIHYHPRGTEDTQVNEVLTAGSMWMADRSDAEDEESEAFQHTLICGLGVTENRLSYEDGPAGDYVEEAINPLEFYWDKSARKKGLKDARRMWRVRKRPIDEARDMFPDARDEDLDAAWALSGGEGDEARSWEEKQEREEGGEGPADTREVTLVECQWQEREPYWMVADPFTGQKAEFSEGDYRVLTKRLKEFGIEDLPAVKMTRRVYKRAFIGSDILEIGEAPCEDRFSWAVITGEPDHTEGTWYGLVRVMRDPQTWANKWLSTTMHIMNSSAKGGILAEKDAFEDQAQAEDTYAQPDAITWIAPGAISGPNPKIMPKPMAQLPAGYYQLLEFAVSSIRDVTGINLELLGMREANQPGILEAQRKQAAMSILATMFDSLRFFRKQVGRIRLYFMQHFLADGRLLRVAGPEGEQVIAMIPEAVEGEYDVVVADAPSSTSEKERNWAIISQMLPLFREYLTPEVALIVLEYSPLPDRLISAFKALMEKEPSPEEQQQKEMAIQAMQAAIGKDQAEAEKRMAEAQHQQMETQLLPVVAPAAPFRGSISL